MARKTVGTREVTCIEKRLIFHIELVTFPLKLKVKYVLNE